MRTPSLDTCGRTGGCSFHGLMPPLHVVRFLVGQASAESCKRWAKGDLRSAIRPETWKRFAEGLSRNGFFEGELEGSKRYREKMAMAEVRYKIDIERHVVPYPPACCSLPNRW